MPPCPCRRPNSSRRRTSARGHRKPACGTSCSCCRRRRLPIWPTRPRPGSNPGCRPRCCRRRSRCRRAKVLGCCTRASWCRGRSSASTRPISTTRRERTRWLPWCRRRSDHRCQERRCHHQHARSPWRRPSSRCFHRRTRRTRPASPIRSKCRGSPCRCWRRVLSRHRSRHRTRLLPPCRPTRCYSPVCNRSRHWHRTCRTRPVLHSRRTRRRSPPFSRRARRSSRSRCNRSRTRRRHPSAFRRTRRQWYPLRRCCRSCSRRRFRTLGPRSHQGNRTGTIRSCRGPCRRSGTRLCPRRCCPPCNPLRRTWWRPRHCPCSSPTPPGKSRIGSSPWHRRRTFRRGKGCTGSPRSSRPGRSHLSSRAPRDTPGTRSPCARQRSGRIPGRSCRTRWCRWRMPPCASDPYRTRRTP